MSHQSELISQDIERYLQKHEDKQLLRFLTCGSVDDGKSTLIGRLLHDSKMIYEDQLAAIKKDSARIGNAGEELDLALLVDGLQAEREQGITIDVAYRYFSTEKRKFIIADTPGHEQYTRNMATGASSCDLAIILIDARHGVQVQTKRHSFITAKLGIKHTIVAINKMDLVDYDQQRFEQIKADYLEFAAELGQQDLQFMPISALKGDNIVNPSTQMDWYQGEPLLTTLENIQLNTGVQLEHLRFPVQYVNRPNLNFRGYCGTLTSGVVKVGDEIRVLPSGKRSKVASIITYDGELQEAYPPMSVTLTLEDEIDISRGDTITHYRDQIQTSDKLTATLVWMSEQPLNIGSTYDIKLLAGRVAGSVVNIQHKIDVNTLAKQPAHNLALNEIALCDIQLERPVIGDIYSQLPGTGSFIIIDRFSNATVGAGMIEQVASNDQQQQLFTDSQYSAEQKASRFGQRPALLSFSTDGQESMLQVLFSLEKKLIDSGRAVAVLSDSTTEFSDAASAQLLLANGLLVLAIHSDNLAPEQHFDLSGKVVNSALIDELFSAIQDKGII
ncbi:MAG: sulfate adenylyltransferase subunit CysN [Pseudomonadales bacterium]|nr:sulfate adenylyltransferase subunit CysN [Pseudomonadales bacterium]NRA17198.1 sulfate adenylyltransferase subunit CysN [Oceanospirillaceae bacterium]